jgi:hypothetical protein
MDPRLLARANGPNVLRCCARAHLHKNKMSWGKKNLASVNFFKLQCSCRKLTRGTMMIKTIVVLEPVEAEQEIAQLGLKLPMAHKIARAAAAARASTLDIDVAFAPGMLSYIYGTRQLRLELLPYDWRQARFNNVESVINDKLGIQIIFQNVDVACDEDHSPLAISGKGAGSRQLVQEGLQGELFERALHSQSDLNQTDNKIGVMPVVWAFCVSNDGTRLCAELSKPDNFEGGQFGKFSTRIFLLDEESGPEPDVEKRRASDDDVESAIDVEVKVVRK